MKTCSKCGVPKDESEFYLRSDSGKLAGSCKQCNADYDRKRYLDNPDYAKEKCLRWYKLNFVKAKERDRNWRKDNLARARRSVNLRHERRQKEDPKYRITRNLRRRLHHVVSSLGLHRKESTFSLLGCPWVWLEVHLESLFKPGMSWENYGPVWHIDHIRPCASFDRMDPEQQRICFHWTNLQPLFAEENIRKNDTYNPPGSGLAVR